MEHTKQITPLPWKVSVCIIGPHSRNVAVIAGQPLSLTQICNTNRRNLEEAEANAAFIVRACNAHDDLLEAVKMALGYLEIDDPGYKRRLREVLISAIAKAEGGNK